MDALLACYACRGLLVRNAAWLQCAQCGQAYTVNRFGFAELIPPDLAEDGPAIDTTTSEYAEDQHATEVRVLQDYLLPLLRNEPFHSVLDVGCGVGASVRALRAAGYEAYGVDLPALSRFWAEAGNDSSYFFACSAERLPFANDCFDVVYSLGVVEHIGTLTGHCTLRRDFVIRRQRYADEIVRVTKPGGRIIIACPNKSFPIDIQHGPTDDAGPGSPLRSLLFNLTGVNLHRTWGPYHLLSYSEVKALFSTGSGTRKFRALPLARYFAFGRFQRGFLRPFGRLAELYVNRLPRALLASCFNPYVMVEIRK